MQHATVQQYSVIVKKARQYSSAPLSHTARHPLKGTGGVGQAKKGEG